MGANGFTESELRKIEASLRRSMRANPELFGLDKNAFANEPPLDAPYLAHIADGNVSVLKAEYKKAAAILHPDVNNHPDATKHFQDLQREYEDRMTPKPKATAKPKPAPKPAPAKKEHILIIRDLRVPGVIAKDGEWQEGWGGFGRGTVAFSCGKCGCRQKAKPDIAYNIYDLAFNRCGSCNIQNFYQMSNGNLLRFE